MAGFLPARPCCQLSELLGIYFGSRARLIKRSTDGQAAYFSLLRNAVARKVVRLGRSVGHMEATYQAAWSAFPGPLKGLLEGPNLDPPSG